MKLARWMAIDLGDRRIGIAIADPSGTIASPAGYVTRRAGHRVPLTTLIARATELEAQGFVVGLALDEHGEEGPRALEARRLGEELGRRTGLPVRLVDERFTTTAAMRAVHEMGGKVRGRKGDLDAIAATVLLQFAMQSSERESP